MQIASCYQRAKDCEQIEQLLLLSPSAPFLSLKDINPTSIDSLTEVNYPKECGAYKTFNTQLGNGRLFTMYSLVNCEQMPITGAPRFGGVLWLNSAQKMLFNGNLTVLDSIKDQTRRAFSTKHHSSLSIKWDEKTDLGFIEEVLEKVLESKTKFYEYLASEKFGKNLCQIAKSELKQLTDSVACKVIFYNKHIQPPPPPPPIIEIND